MTYVYTYDIIETKKGGGKVIDDIIKALTVIWLAVQIISKTYELTNHKKRGKSKRRK